MYIGFKFLALRAREADRKRPLHPSGLLIVSQTLEGQVGFAGPVGIDGHTGNRGG